MTTEPASVKPPSRRARNIVIGFIFAVAVASLVGAAFEWQDEHSGTAGKAHVTRCLVHTMRNISDDCEGTWIYKGRAVTGDIANAGSGQLGKTISVRIHSARRATVPTTWIPIGLAAMGILFGLFAFWLISIFRRQDRRMQNPSDA